MVLKWHAVSKAFGSRVVFEGASVSIEEGEFVGIVGPSGVGKTTMVLISSGILKPDAGEVYVDGSRIDILDRNSAALFRRRNIGIVFQFFNLVPVLTVAENVALPLELNGIPKKKALARAKELLELLGLGSKADSFPSSLSGGEQQRVAVLRAVIHRPRLILADEPTGNLDEANKIRVFELLRRFNREFKVTVVVVTHDVELASKFVDRLIKISSGRFIEV